MKKLSKFVLFTIGVAACALPTIRAEAINPACPACQKRQARTEQFQQHLKQRGEKMAEKLGLTAEQQAQMKTIRQEQHTAAGAIRENPALTTEQKQDKIRLLRQDFKARRMALLTPEQQKKAKEMRAKHEGKRQRLKG